MAQHQEPKKQASVKRSKVILAAMRFEIVLPDDLPRENGDRYALERFKKLCDKLNSIKGVAVEYTLS